jgi:hypothetical protein
MIKSPFLALERDKWRERMKSIKDFEDKKGCDGIHTLSYGSLGEHQQEMIIQQEVENQEENEKSEQSEQKEQETKEFPQEKYLEIKK